MISSFGIISFYITINILKVVIEKPLAYFFALMFFPIVGFVMRNSKYYTAAFAFVYYCISIYVMKYSGAQAAFYGFALGGGIFLLTLYKAEMTSLVLKYGSFFFIVISPALSYFLLANPQRLLPYINGSLTSFFHRLCIWNYVSNKIVEKPLLGWGLGASKHFPGGDGYFFQNVPASEAPYLTILYNLLGDENPVYIVNLPLHPHNNLLQVFFELGIPGGLIYAFLIAAIFKMIQTTFQDKIILASANALAVLTLVICNMSHSVWHIWILSWIVLSFGLLYAVHRLSLLEKQNQNL